MSHARLYIAADIDAAGIAPELRTQSADTEHFMSEAFGIDDARRLNARAHRKAVTEVERSFLVSFGSITREAQNALLKLFEEPPAGVAFHVVIPREDMLLPTLRSRMQLMNRAEVDTQDDAFTKFLGNSFKERMDAIAARAKAKDAVWFEAVAAGVEAHIAAAPSDADESLRRSIPMLRSYMGARGASQKMLFEELALALPVRS